MMAPSTRDLARETRDIFLVAGGASSEGAGVPHLVMLHALLHERVYGVSLVLPPRDRARAEQAASAVLSSAFGGDVEEMAPFVFWAWDREKNREKASREKNLQRRPLSWQLLFSSAFASEWRVERMRKGDASVGTDEGIDDALVSERPTIFIDEEERRAADEALAALAASNGDQIYARGGQLVRVVVEGSREKVLLRAPSTPRIAPVTAPTLRERLSECALFTRDGRPVGPPEFIVRALLDRGEWPPLPRLRAIVDAPVLRANGSISDAEGYDPLTEILVMPSCTIEPIPESPSREEALLALEVVKEVFCDFPFEHDHHRAGAVAAMLTPFARFAFDGPAPLFLIDKNTRGAGGTLHADVIGITATGRPLPRMIAAKSAEEERKRITSIAMAGDSIVLIDNVSGVLGTDALDAALTATSWRDRILATNTMISVPLVVTWLATGNNVECSGDTLRRVCPIRLSSPDEEPEERAGFKHPDLLAWVRTERPRLVRSILLMLRAYCVAGRPDMGLRPWGSYEGWSSLVRNTVVWLGLPDPAAGRREMTSSADAERSALADMLGAWRSAFGGDGSTVAAMLRRLESSAGEIDPDMDTLRESLAELVPTRNGMLPTARAIGAALSGRVVAWSETSPSKSPPVTQPQAPAGWRGK